MKKKDTATIPTTGGPEDRRTELNYTSPPKYAKPPSHTPHTTHHTPHTTHHTHTPHSHHTSHIITSSHHHIITSSHQLIFTHTINTTKHSSSSLPKSETTYPLISFQRDEYVYPPTTNKFFPSICLGMIGQRSRLRDVHIFVLKQLTHQ